MKEKTKEFLKKYLIGFILGIVSACTISVIAATYFPSNDVTYDNSESGLTSTNVQGAIDELYGVCMAKPAGEQIIENAGLEKDPYECRYFFTGANPNNYITFNGEKAGWRIISVECDGTIKIMRNDSIGNMAWDTYDDRQYPKWARPSSLNTYLNGTYYNGLNSIAQSQIVTKDWGIGAIEFDNNDLAGQVNAENATKWNGKIALPTASEILRINSNENCKTYMLYDKNYNVCKSATWLHTNSYWWTLSYQTGGTLINFGEHFNIYRASTVEMGVYPTLYLSSDIQITGGTGTSQDPYVVS